mmetsp:Transcript_19935/g.17034  ORF Transcript_19935/g.17034 Transcript_19935/m.17034 type:complete len:91 (+) Transcript_19935:3828-4100(+)
MDPKSQNQLEDEEEALVRLNANSHEVPKTVAFSPAMDRIFGVTAKGLFSVWELKNLKMIDQKNLKSYLNTNSNIVSMIVFKTKALILIAF